MPLGAAKSTSPNSWLPLKKHIPKHLKTGWLARGLFQSHNLQAKLGGPLG
jgi:hypothetical protein